jgi:hypothetical protein
VNGREEGTGNPAQPCLRAAPSLRPIQSQTLNWPRAGAMLSTYGRPRFSPEAPRGGKKGRRR